MQRVSSFARRDHPQALEVRVFRPLLFKLTVACMAFPPLGANLAAQTEPDLAGIAMTGLVTSERLKQEPAAWKVVFELPNGGEAMVEVVSAVTMRRLDISLDVDATKKPLLRIINRDGHWYVEDHLGRFKYRPYEAPVLLPAFYLFLARSEPRFVAHESEQLGEFRTQDGNVATYDSSLPASTQQQVEDALKQLQAIEQTQPDRMTDELRQTKNKLQKLKQGSALKVNVDTGLVEQYGNVGQRVWVKDFRWIDQVDSSLFDVSSHDWQDRSNSIVADGASRENVIMIGNAMAWQPGQQGNDTDLTLLDISTGNTRRVPFALGVALGGCFSHDRQHVYIAGQIPDRGSLAIFEIDLLSGEHRLLGGPELEAGITLFPVLSPNGRYLAATHMDQSSGPLNSKLYLIEVETGRSKAIAKPMDLAHVSWLPSGEGVVFVTREHQTLEGPTTSTICRLDFKGELTKIRPGDFPVVLPDSRILFQDEGDDLWKTCSLEGEDIQLVGDGLKDYAFPAPAPDGQRMIMMKFDAETPTPFLIDITTGNARAIPVGPGLWAMPSWR